MGSIVTTIEVNATGASEVEGLASALKEANEQLETLKESLRTGLGTDSLSKPAAALGEMAASMRTAVKGIKDDLGQLGDAAQRAAGRIKASADAAKGLADADKAVADSAKAAADSQKSLADGSAMAGRNMTGAADAGKALADAGKAVADASPAAAGGIKDVAAASADQARAARDAAAWMAETNRITRDYGLTSAEMAAVVNRSQLSVAKSQKALTDVQVTASREAAKAQRAAAAETEASAGRAHNVVLGVAGALGYGIYKAAQFQTQITRLYTSAGESKPNLPMISQGILGMAGPTATSQTDLVHGMYWVESGGFHGQTALNVLRSVAQGAYAEGAPLQDVANAATSILTSYGMYHPTQKQANSVVNQMLTAVGSGKMTMAGLSTALPSVLPVAASAGISLPQVLGTLATMTATGMSPEWASTNLSHTIGKLQNPTAVMTAEMYQLGLDPVAISQQLGKRQISGTFGEIQSAIKAHTNKAGEVVLPAMNISKSAQQDALMMMRQMPGAIRQIAEAYYDGHMSQAAWNKELFKGTESGQMGILLKQFGTLTALAHGYNSALKAGQPDVQAYSAAVTKTLGDSVAMRTFLMTTGTHAQVASQTIGGVAQAAKDAGVDVQGWPYIQKTFGYQLKSFEASATAAATTAGTALLPAATDVMSGLAKAGTFLSQHKKLTVDLAIAGGGLALVEAGKKLASPLMTVLNGVGKIGQALKIPGLDKLAGIGKNAGLGGLGSSATAAAGGLDLVGPAADEAAAALGRLGGIGDTGLPGVKGKQGKPGEPRPGEPRPGEPKPGEHKPGEHKPGAGLGAPSVIATLLADTVVFPWLQSKKNSLGNWLDNAFGTPKTSGWNSWSSFGHDVTTMWGLLGRGQPASGGRGAWLTGVPAVPHPDAAQPAAAVPQAPYSGDFTRSRLASMGLGPADNQQMTGDLARYKAQYAGHITLPVKIQADEAGLAGISSKLRAITNLSAPKVNMSGVTSSVQAGMSSAAAAARSGSGQVTSAVAEIGAKVRSVTASFAGGMASAGASMDQGLASGIASGEGAVVGAATAVAAAAEGAMRKELQTHSPSKKTVRIGEQAVEGLVISLLGGQAAVDAAANALGKAAVPSDIASIVKATAQIGALIRQAVSGKEIPQSEGTALTKMLKRDQTRLEALARQRAVLETEIANASQLTTSAVGQSSILNASQVTQAGPQAAQSPDEIVSGMQQQAASALQFSAELAKLQKAGLNATSLAQLAQGGPQSLATAHGIDAGGKAAISAINQSESQIIKAGQQMGDVGGVAMYQSGADFGDGVAKGLKSKLSADSAAMQQLAKQMLQSLEAALGGTGKGSVGYQIGQDIAQGIAAGLGASASAVATPATAAATAAAGGGKGHGHGHPKAKGHDGASHPVAYYGGGSGAPSGYSAPEGPVPGFQGGTGLPGALPFGGGYHGGAPVQHHHHYSTTVNVHAAGVMSERDLHDVVQEATLVHGSNNWQTGNRYPGRGA